MYGFGRMCENCQDERAETGEDLCALCIENEIEDELYEGEL